MAKGRNNLFEVRHPIFRPLWRRVLVTGLCLGWAAFELANGAMLWAIFFGACGIHLFVQFFIRFDPAHYQTTGNKDSS